ncbi:MAG: hypothetical protein FWD71_02365 [Oscillospiraceae bacterium]|nr:hypothetical protein [Oscillospiraceae bacterium]
MEIIGFLNNIDRFVSEVFSLPSLVKRVPSADGGCFVILTSCGEIKHPSRELNAVLQWDVQVLACHPLCERGLWCE